MIKYLIIILAPLFFVMCNNNTTEPDEKNNDVKREYKKSIERIYKNDFEEQLIRKAESLYPDRDSVLAVVDSIYHQYIPDSNYWHYSSFDGVLIPYTITSEAINYYTALIDTMKIIPSEIFITAEFYYRSEIKYHELYEFQGVDQFTEEPLGPETYTKIYVVKMELKWEHYCGPMCGLWINRKREIIFDKDGNLIKIYYDGQIPVVVS